VPDGRKSPEARGMASGPLAGNAPPPYQCAHRAGGWQCAARKEQRSRRALRLVHGRRGDRNLITEFAMAMPKGLHSSLPSQDVWVLGINLLQTGDSLVYSGKVRSRIADVHVALASATLKSASNHSLPSTNCASIQLPRQPLEPEVHPNLL